MIIKEFPTLITIKNKHNHELNTAAVLKYRDVSNEVKEKLIDLFRQGHNPSSALNSHKLDLMMEYEDNDYYRIAADGKFLPSISIVTKLFEKEFNSKYGNLTDKENFDHLENLLNEYVKVHSARAGFSYTTDKEHYFVVLCTPIMLRIHKTVVQTSEVVMVDASGGVDKQRHRIYFLVTPTAAGGLPLGVIISDSEKESVFLEALTYLRNLVGTCAFNFKRHPKVFITDNDLKEINAIKKVFPESKTLLCQFHMLKSVWSWLCNQKHDVMKEDRQEIYFMFKNLLYSASLNCVNEAFSKLIFFTISKGYRKLNQYLNNLWRKKETWISYYRNALPLRGNNTTNYIEIVFRILKDCILNRTMAFNLTQLVDFILTRYELYLKQRLTDFGNGRYSSSLLKKMLPFKSSNDFSVEKQFDTPDIYKVKCLQEEQTVDIIRGICTCSLGTSGKMCKHSSAVIFSLENDIKTAYNLVCTSTKRDMLYIANGIRPPPEWFSPLQKSLDSSIQTLPETSGTQKYTELLAEDHGNDADSGESQTLSDQELAQLETLFDRIKNGAKSNPTIFVPAIQKMLFNATSFANTETGLVSALYTFGSYSGVEQKNKRTLKSTKSRRSHRIKIGVQPTAIGRRKYCLPGKRKVSAGRPAGSRLTIEALQPHNYTTFGHLPSRKRKAPHNLESCVYDNKSLGMTKQAKM
ncbi:uncharacterized protein LOC126879645 [Diabrotica virgifera virgifera]|uniref:SWIM-type domain-containing protein n=1 Tax=Diabrotica virgifera virgifera TaxID=50390 RepID=A0ABM5JLH3_DIAVI|nr:uncharacterized protein LOC126879645 [Diabrotica virgifera virgifera]